MKNTSYASNDNIALLCDVDLTLVETMSTDLALDKVETAREVHDRLEGAFGLVTGRPGDSLDKTFPFLPPAAVEHYSAIRREMGENYQSLVTPINSEMIAAYAKEKLSDTFTIFNDQRQILGHDFGVFVESKMHSLALIFTVRSITPERRNIVNAMGQEVLERFNLESTHHLAFGRDATEIVAKGVAKPGAVRDFMGTPAFKGRRPIMIGDSSTDAAAMKVCEEEYGGGGVAVGDGIPDAPYILARVENIDQAWDVVRDISRANAKLAMTG